MNDRKKVGLTCLFYGELAGCFFITVNYQIIAFRLLR